MPKLNVNDISLYYETHGVGTPLLLLHGLGSSSRDWELQLPAFTPYFEVLLVDVRGHGRTDKPRGPYRVAQLAADIAALLRRLGRTPAHVVGISMGGMIGLQLAADYGEMARSLVVVNAMPALEMQSWRDWIQAWQRLALIRLLGMGYMGDYLAKRLFPAPRQAALRDAIRERWAHNDTRAYLAAYRALLGWSVADRLPQITLPALIIAADGDYWPVAAKRKAFAPMPNASLRVIAHSRHATPIDQPEAFNMAVVSFLQRVEAECTN